MSDAREKRETAEESIYLNFSDINPRADITQFGRVFPTGEYAMSRRILRHFFDYIVSGHGYVTRGGETFRVSAGDLVYIRKGTFADYGADKADPYGKYWIGADGSLLDVLADEYLDGRDIVIRHGVSPEDFLRLGDLLTEKNTRERDVTHALFDLFFLLSGFGTAEKETGGLAGELREYIYSLVDGDFSLDEASERFHVSKRHLIRVFKERFGRTPGAYHAAAKLSAARRYLSETELSVGEIAARLGYCDQSYFSASFRKTFGVYPTKWRAENRI